MLMHNTVAPMIQDPNMGVGGQIIIGLKGVKREAKWLLSMNEKLFWSYSVSKIWFELSRIVEFVDK